MPHSDFVQRGAALLGQRDYQEAVKTCRLGLLSRPQALEGRLILGRALLALGRVDEALQEMKIALELAPGTPAVYALRGEALLRKGEIPSARAALRLALGLSPGDPHILALLEDADGATMPNDGGDPTAVFDPIEGGDETETKHYARATAGSGRAAEGTPAGGGLGEALSEPETARAGPQEDTLLVALSAAGQVGPDEIGWTSQVAKKNNTEPLNDEALVEVPPMRPGRPAGGPPPLPGVRPSKAHSVPPPVPSRGRPSAPPPLPSAPPAPSAAPPPLPGWSPMPPGPLAASPLAPTMLPTAAAGPPAMAPTMQAMPAMPPPAPAPLAAQHAGAFAAYQSGVGLPHLVEGPSGPRGPIAGPPPAAPKADKRRAARPKRKARSGLATFLWVLVGAAVIGGGVLAGFEIRDLRLRRQIEAAERRGRESSASDAWLGWRVARDGLASIAAARRTPQSRAALAQAQAILAYELGDGLAEALASLRALGPTSEAAPARAYVALVAGTAGAVSDELRQISDDMGTASYLKGRAALLQGDAKAALAALERAYKISPRPFTAAGIAQAHALAGRWDEADKVLTAALAKVPAHPGLMLTRVQLAHRLGRLSAAALAEAIAQLDALIAEADKPLTAQARGVSPWQKALALLTKGSLLAARGDRPAALAALAAALELGIDEQRVAEATLAALVEVELPEVVSTAGKRALAAWPQSVALRVELARGAFSAGRLAEAVELLPDALISSDPRALALRARARLLSDDVDGARRDLELAAKAQGPELEAARALVTLASGGKLDEWPSSARVDFALVEAQRLRAGGAADKAVLKLRGLLERPLGGERFAVLLELGRASRETADYAGARALYNELVASADPQARLETAQLLLEDRDPKGARVHIEALLRDRGAAATGAMLVEAMRIRTLTGATAAAQELAAKATTAGAAPWMVQRELARIARRRDDLPAAAAALGKALDGSKADLDTLLMACDVVEAAEPALASKIAKAVEERLVGTPELLVGQGKLALARGDVAKATELFDKAAQRFKERPASPRRLAQVSFGAGALAVGRAEWVMARRKLEAAIELDPSLIDAYTYLAVALARVNEVPRAVALLRTATELAPESALVWDTLADYATAARDAKTAAEAKRRAAAIRSK